MFLYIILTLSFTFYFIIINYVQYPYLWTSCVPSTVLMFPLNEYIILYIHPSIHCSMGSAPVGVQCPLTSSLGEFLGYGDGIWYPGLSLVLVSITLPFAFHISVFLFPLLHQPLDFIRLFFKVAVSAHRHQPSS